METLDTRDLYKRKCELEKLKESVTCTQEELEMLQREVEDNEKEEEISQLETELEKAQEDFGEPEKCELAELESIESGMDGRACRDGVTLIPEDEFEDYARELAEETEEIPNTWPHRCIDWTQAAEELKQDYSSVTYQGIDYLFRE